MLTKTRCWKLDVKLVTTEIVQVTLLCKNVISVLEPMVTELPSVGSSSPILH